jgi:hypothetical protein
MGKIRNKSKDASVRILDELRERNGGGAPPAAAQRFPAPFFR